MTRQEIKARAKDQLGNNLFCNAWLFAVLACFIFSVICSAAGSIIVGIGAVIVTGPLSFGLNYLFLKQARDNQPMELGDLFKGFSEDFSQNLLIGLMTAIFTALWSLLLIVPGIVKAYSYAMVYYIKADHPEYNWRQCIAESQAMMNGHKMDLFIMDLSFIGWMIVGSLCLGVGTLWVSAYMEAARAHFYESIQTYVIE